MKKIKGKGNYVFPEKSKEIVVYFEVSSFTL